VLLLPPHRWS